MTPERLRQIRNLFEAALDRDGDARTAFLEEAAQGDPSLRKEVERLLAAHQQGTGLLEQGVRPELLTGEPDRMEGRRIDHYEILRELGHGGMGSVYQAARTDGVYRNPVALKVVRPEAGSREIIERFRQERQILAALDHPNIARLLDGGTTPEGLPYLVMEYVEGQPIDVYCDERKLSVAERLGLFRTVCAAAEYAHGHGVVHRDLKPGNILVTANGKVKLLDFGVAKLLRTDADEITAAYVTRTGMHLMTPEYASPEQVRTETVGAASDIYSLGVILYELLTGHRPYRLSSRLIHEVVRVICEEDPTRPSTAVTEVEQRQGGDDKPVAVTPESVSRARAATPNGLRRQLSGDPDKIVLKALRKDPAQRYPTADAFGEDVRRHLDGLPVLAQGESLVYRAWKFLQRYRLWVLGAAVIAAGLASGTVKINPLGPAVVVMKPPALIALFALCAALLIGYPVISSELDRGATFEEVFLPALTVAVCVLSVIGIYRLNPFYSDRLAFFLYFALVILRTLVPRALWPFRARWAGALLLDLGQLSWFPRAYRHLVATRPTWATAYSALFVVVGILVVGAVWMSVLAIATFAKHSGVADIPAELIMLGLGALYFSFSPPGIRVQTEIRQRGILHQGAFLRWSRIESYAWQQAKGELVVLTLRTRSLFRFPWRRRIVLTAAQKSPTNAILGRQLSQWPGV